MSTESIESGFLSIFALFTFFIFLLVNKLSNKYLYKSLLDNDFDKPQAFHREAITRSGGVAIFISLIFFLYINNILFEKILFEYFLVGLSVFIIGFVDDLKIKIQAKTRLFFMIASLIILIFIFNIEIERIDLFFLNTLMENQLFSIFFVLLCFLFIINGANLIDGFNGLLTINLIIINSLLLFVNLQNQQFEISFFITAQLIILLCFLLFNFPKAKMFLGDSGSYLLGSIVALNTIYTNNLNPNISSFFFGILLFYLFFEVFFSFIRKIYQKKSPIHPDNLHLHMLSFKKIEHIFSVEKRNYMNSVLINLIYFILVFPSIYFASNDVMCKYWFFSLILIYTLFYLRLYRLTKN